MKEKQRIKCAWRSYWNWAREDGQRNCFTWLLAPFMMTCVLFYIATHKTVLFTCDSPDCDCKHLTKSE